MPKKATPWLKLVKQTLKQNPNKKFGEILKIAATKYKK